MKFVRNHYVTVNESLKHKCLWELFWKLPKMQSRVAWCCFLRNGMVVSLVVHVFCLFISLYLIIIWICFPWHPCCVYRKSPSDFIIHLFFRSLLAFSFYILFFPSYTLMKFSMHTTDERRWEFWLSRRFKRFLLYIKTYVVVFSIIEVVVTSQATFFLKIVPF